MKTKIEKLTPRQERDLRATCEEWLAVGRSTSPLDRAGAAKAIGDMYERIGEDRPAVLFFSSPIMCVLAYGTLRTMGVNRDQLWDQLRDQLWDQLRDQLGVQLWVQLRDQLRDQLGDQLWDQLWGQLKDQLGDQLGVQLRGQLRGQLWDQLRDQLGDQLWVQLRVQLRDQLGDQLWDQLRVQLGVQLWDQLRDQLWDQLRDQLRGQLKDQLRGQVDYGRLFAGHHWCAWEVFYDFCRRIGVAYTVDQNAKLDLWLEQSRQCHWWWPYKGIVLASERHTTLSVDDRGRLHCTDGPAVAYSDGWGVFAIHGVRVDGDFIIDRSKLTVERIEAESNAEVRRVMIELFGQARYLVDSGAKEIHRDDWGTLYRKDLPDDEPLVMVKVANSTREPDGSFKDYFLRVQPDLRPMLADGTLGEPQAMTARNAVASTFGLRGEQYQPTEQT